MTVEEARQILQFLSAAYRVELTELQAAVWLSTLGDLDYAAAKKAAKLVKDESQWFPSHAEFIAACKPTRSRALAANYHAPFGPVVDPPRLDPAEAKRRFDVMRDAVGKTTETKEKN